MIPNIKQNEGICHKKEHGDEQTNNRDTPTHQWNTVL